MKSLLRRIYGRLHHWTLRGLPHWRMGIIAVASFVIGFWLATPDPPWMEVIELHATYRVGALEVPLTGQYRVNRECSQREDLRWRIELVATDGQIAQFAPPEPRPSLRRGNHIYAGSIPLTHTIEEDGWTASLLITCRGEEPETVVSTAARVIRVKTFDSEVPSPP